RRLRFCPTVSRPHPGPCYREDTSGPQSLPRLATAVAARPETVRYPYIASQLLRLDPSRGQPASSGFEWHFPPTHNSSADFSTSVGSDLHLVSPKLHPGHR